MNAIIRWFAKFGAALISDDPHEPKDQDPCFVIAQQPMPRLPEPQLCPALKCSGPLTIDGPQNQTLAGLGEEERRGYRYCKSCDIWWPEDQWNPRQLAIKNANQARIIRGYIALIEAAKDAGVVFSWEGKHVVAELPGADRRREQWPQACHLCQTNMESPEDRAQWHGLGNCVPVCLACLGSGIEGADPTRGLS